MTSTPRGMAPRPVGVGLARLGQPVVPGSMSSPRGGARIVMSHRARASSRWAHIPSRPSFVRLRFWASRLPYSVTISSSLDLSGSRDGRMWGLAACLVHRPPRPGAGKSRCDVRFLGVSIPWAMMTLCAHERDGERAPRAPLAQLAPMCTPGRRAASSARGGSMECGTKAGIPWSRLSARGQ